MNKLGIYIHVPFCITKCSYCDFYSLGYCENLAEEYTKRILLEVNRWGRELNTPPADTLYFGGGTPSLLDWAQIKAIIDRVKEQFSLNNPEITMEVNPAEELFDYFKKVAKAGVNRISLGLQSANENELAFLSRRHTANDVERAVLAAREAGINNISLDVMIGIPGQTKQSLKRTLDFALSLKPEHISAYLLSIEEGTPLFKNQKHLNIPDDDMAGELYLFALKELSKNGFERYEISNFAKNGNISQHNYKYWLGVDYLGLGPGAHSLINNKRFYYERDLKKYLISPTEIEDGDGGGIEEYVMLRIRLKKGLSVKKLANKFQKEITENKISRLSQKARLLEKNGLVVFDGEYISLTDEGALVSNSIISSVLESIYK